MTTSDAASYRSKYLSIVRATDENGQPIFEPEYAGTDDNGTPNDDTDDNYLYYIRPYVLKDTGNSNAMEGTITLYNPDLDAVATWNIANLPCRQHSDAHDGLSADSTGIKHDVLMKVPVAAMEYAGYYRFVAHIRDAHSSNYRDHQNKWALNLNTAKPIQGLAIMTYTGRSEVLHHESLMDCTTNAQLLESTFYTIPYAPKFREYKCISPGIGKGIARFGGGGILYDANNEPHYAVRSLDALWPGDDSSSTKYCRKNVIWIYIGHAVGVSLTSFGGWSNPDTSCNLTQYNQVYDDYTYIGLQARIPDGPYIFNLGHIKLAVLLACFTGDDDNIMYTFRARGAHNVLGFKGYTYPATTAYGNFVNYILQRMVYDSVNLTTAVAKAKARYPILCLRGLPGMKGRKCDPATLDDGTLLK